MSVFVSVTYCFLWLYLCNITWTVWWPPTLIFFCMILLYLSVICCAVWIFEFLMYISLKNTREIFMVIWLSLWISFIRIITFTILILPIHELVRSFHLMSSPVPPGIEQFHYGCLSLPWLSTYSSSNAHSAIFIVTVLTTARQ